VVSRSIFFCKHILFYFFWIVFYWRKMLKIPVNMYKSFFDIYIFKKNHFLSYYITFSVRRPLKWENHNFFFVHVKEVNFYIPLFFLIYTFFKNHDTLSLGPLFTSFLTPQKRSRRCWGSYLASSGYIFIKVL